MNNVFPLSTKGNICLRSVIVTVIALVKLLILINDTLIFHIMIHLWCWQIALHPIGTRHVHYIRTAICSSTQLNTPAETHTHGHTWWEMPTEIIVSGLVTFSNDFSKIMSINYKSRCLNVMVTDHFVFKICIKVSWQSKTKGDQREPTWLWRRKGVKQKQPG